MSSITSHLAQYFEWLALISVVMLIATLVAVPALVARIPEDYFCHPRRVSVPARHPLLRWLLFSLKNLFGALLVLAGLIMLVTPGQGLLTLLIGLMIMNYPGKYQLERWLITRLRLLPALNWLRQRRNKPPLIVPDSLPQAADPD